jgi:hypothetical protein
MGGVEVRLWLHVRDGEERMRAEVVREAQHEDGCSGSCAICEGAVRNAATVKYVLGWRSDLIVSALMATSGAVKRYLHFCRCL